MNIEKSCRSKLFPILTGLALPLCSSATAEVIVYFEQDGPDVTASWSGTLDHGRTTHTASSLEGTIRFSGQAGIFQLQRDEFFPAYRGNARLTPLSDTIQKNQTEQLLSFGFSGANLFLPSVQDSEPPDFQVFNFDPSVHLIRFSGQTLAGMGAENLINTLAWTSSTGDTIRYTTGPVPAQAAVPEPSSALLGFFLLGSLCLLNRRR